MGQCGIASCCKLFLDALIYARSCWTYLAVESQCCTQSWLKILILMLRSLAVATEAVTAPEGQPDVGGFPQVWDSMSYYICVG